MDESEEDLYYYEMKMVVLLYHLSVLQLLLYTTFMILLSPVPEFPVVYGRGLYHDNIL